MIGRTIASQPPSTRAALLGAGLATALLILALALGNPHWALAAIVPMFIASALWLTREPSLLAQFTETSLDVLNPPLSIPYQDMEGLSAPGRPAAPTEDGPPAYPMHVIYDEGVLEIPAHLDVPSDDVYRFLCGQFTPGGSREVNVLLADYLARQEQTFGAPRVWSYRARRHLGSRFVPRKTRAVFLAIGLAGLSWTAVGATAREFVAWIPAGLCAALVGGFMYLCLLLDSRRLPDKVKNWRQASLVISPVGLAMVQGDEKGEMRWDELRGAKLQRGGRLVQSSEPTAAAGIVLTVDAASFVIVDIYDRPLPVIFERIQQYWR